jgi:hypothetical protein
MGSDEGLHPLAGSALGDLVTLPDGRGLSVRARVSLPVPEGSMAGFVILGELELLLSLPPLLGAPFSVYVPISYLPEYAADAKSVFEGVTSYWSPHLPAVSGAMGELAWRVLRVRNRLDPLVLVYRGPEMVVFVKASEAAAGDVHVRFMSRTGDNDVAVARQSALVGSPSPVVVPQRTLVGGRRA